MSEQTRTVAKTASKAAVNTSSQGSVLQRAAVKVNQSLRTEINPYTEGHLGHDFSRVQVHHYVPTILQAKLTIGQPGDQYEREADNLADTVMRISDPGRSETQSIGSAPVNELRREPDDEEEKRKNPALGSRDSSKILSNETQKKDDDETMQRKESGATPSVVSGQSAPPIVHDVLHSSGQSLDTSTLGFMESRFGHDFSGVRVHTNEQAAESARSVNALAYTVGHDVVFGQGQYAPGTMTGNRLLAHELTHVVQQKQGITSSQTVIQRQLITPLAQGGGFKGLIERDRESTNKPESDLSIADAIQGGWRLIAELTEHILRTATTGQRITMLSALIQAYWTGSKEEEAIIRILSTTPVSQAPELVKQLSEQKINSKPYLDELDRVVDLGNNLELHTILSELRLKAMGPEKGTQALQAAPILPWHDVMGFFEDAATFFFSRTANGKINIKYPALLFGSKDFASELEKLPTDIFTSGHDYEPNQVLTIHDYEKGRFVSVVAQELIGFQHAGIRGFLGHVTMVASFALPGGAAKTVLGKVAAFTLERLLPAIFLLVDENRLNLVKWFPKWGPKMIYYSDLAQTALGIYGIARFAVSGWKLLQAWKEIRQTRTALEGANVSAEAEKVATTLEKRADEIFAEAEKIHSSEGATAQGTPGESGKSKPTSITGEKAPPTATEIPEKPGTSTSETAMGEGPQAGKSGPATPKGAEAVRSKLPGTTGTRHLPREFDMPTSGRSSFASTSEQIGTVEQRVAGDVRVRGERVGKGEVGIKATEVPGGRTGLREHWQAHGQEFPEFPNARAYEQGAIDFCRDSSTRRFYYRFKGRPTIGYYNIETRTFAATSVNGEVIYTFFRPRNLEDYIRNLRMPEAAAGMPRTMPSGIQPRHSVPLRQE